MRIIRIEEVSWSTSSFYAEVLYYNFWGSINKIEVCAMKLEELRFYNIHTGKYISKKMNRAVIGEVMNKYLTLDA